MMAAEKFPARPMAIFLSHGGGPLPLLGDSSHDEMAAIPGQLLSWQPLCPWRRSSSHG